MTDTMPKYDPNSGLTYQQWYRKYSPKYLAKADERRQKNADYARRRRQDPEEKAKDDEARRKYQQTESYKAAQRRWYEKNGKEYHLRWRESRKDELAKKQADRYRNNPEYREKVKARRRAYYQKNRKKLTDQANGWARKRREEQPEWAFKRDQARAAVNRAKYAGKLVEGPCAHRHRSPCNGRIEAHHYRGYEQENWLSIVWLCHQHHMVEEYNPTNEFCQEELALPWEALPELPEGWKICSRCGTAKPREEYYRDARRPDGLYAKCKPCHNAVTIASEKKRKARQSS